MPTPTTLLGHYGGTEVGRSIMEDKMLNANMLL